MSAEIAAQIVSPQVDQRQVTFRLVAPLAREVKVTGIDGQPDLAMQRGANGLWQGTIGPLEPEIYSYSFLVDGTRLNDPSNRYVKKWLSLSSLFEITGGLIHENWLVPHGDLHHHLYDSISTGVQRGVQVYTPPQYSTLTDELPVVFLLHGYGDDETAWTEVGRASMILDNLIHQQRIPPVVLVMPNGHPTRLDIQRDFDQYASENISNMEKDLLQDLLPFLDRRYRISKKPQHRALAGLSMGGGQAIALGLKHLDQFSRIGSFSASAPHGNFENIDLQMKMNAKDFESCNSVLNLFWIGCGKDDFLLDRNKHFVKWLRSRKIKHSFQLTDGGHDWTVWRRYFVDFMTAVFLKPESEDRPD
jgi:enterochelin esterase family protein